MAVSTNSDDECKGFTCYWRIENFTWKARNNSALSSPAFRIESLKSKWQIEIHEEEDTLTTYLTKITNDSCTKLNLSLSLFSNSGWITILDRCELKFEKGIKEWGVKILNLEDLEIDRKLYTPQGALTLTLKVSNSQMDNETSLCLLYSRMCRKYIEHRPAEIFSTLKSNCLFPFPPLFQFRVNPMAHLDQKPKEMNTQITQTDEMVDFKDEDELLQMFNEKQFNFVTLCTSNKKFVVHKAVLCAKSSVFKAMFEETMVENDCISVDIDDIDSETMTLFIKFLHFEPIGELSQESAVLLYYAADKYQISALKKECIALLAKELSVENVCDVFVLADSHQDKDLMNCAQEYFCNNSKSIFLSNHWKDLILSHPELIAEILHKSAQGM